MLLLLCLKQKELKLDFKFAILIAPFKSRITKHRDWYNICEPISIPTLHVIGDSDKVIEREMSDEILGLFKDPEILRHPGGHFVPASGPQKSVYLDFLGKQQS